MAERRGRDVIGGPDPAPPLLTLTRGGSAVGFAIVVSLIVATAVVEDRRSEPRPRRRATAAPSPTPSPSRSPEQITADQAESRRRAVLNTVRFAAGLVCRDSGDFSYTIRESSSDIVESIVDAFDPTRVDGIVVKVTLLNGAIAYLVQEEHGACDA